MKLKLLLAVGLLMLPQVFTQQSVGFFAPLDATIDETTVTQSIPYLGNFEELVIPVGFSDRDNAWPVLSNSSYYPKHGVFPNCDLLRDSIAEYNNAYPIENWYEPMLDDYFDTHSNGLHTVDFEFIKKSDGKPYTPDYSMAQWIIENNNVDTNVIWNKRKEILLQVAENMYADNQNVFNNINALHFVFNVGSTNPDEFDTTYGGTIEDNLRLESNSVVYFEGPISINWKTDAIPHERLHMMGLPDRKTNISGMSCYDMMDNRGFIVSERSLYGQRPIRSADLMRFGWVASDEILVIDENNYETFGEIKLADLNYSLTTAQKSQGFYRFAKVILDSSSQYFLIEFHNASEYDKNFSNIDEYATNGYNKGALIWHNTDLELAVPYNGWENRTPLPDDSYPRGNYSRANDYLGDLSEGDFDWLNDINTTKINGVDVFTYMPDGGRNIWDTSAYKDMSNPFSWDPTGERWLARTNSKRSDFFTDEVIQGRIINRMTDATRPSTKKKGWTVRVWDGEISVWVVDIHYAKKTHIGIVDIEKKSTSGYDYMSVKVFYNYWEGNITENTTLSGNVRIGGNLTVASNKTLTIAAGTNLVFENGASLIIDGTLNVNGTSGNEVLFDFQYPQWNPSMGIDKNGIKINSTGIANISHAEIRNAYTGIFVNEGVALIDNCLIRNGYSGIHLYRTNYSSSDTYITNLRIYGQTVGIDMYYSTAQISFNEIDHNWIAISCTNFSSPFLAPNSDDFSASFGYNNIYLNSFGLFAISYSNPFLGRQTCIDFGGNNTIDNNSIKDVYLSA
ncbi:MAG: hypothetical protein ABIG69_02025 [Bacteroidota bacterium]